MCDIMDFGGVGCFRNWSSWNFCGVFDSLDFGENMGGD